MRTRKLHEWDLTYGQARALQRRLASRVRFTKIKREPKIIAGLDCAFSKDERTIFAAAVVIKVPDFEVIETTTAARKVDFPYIPGLLSFREAPACIEAIEKLNATPDVFIIDGQGFAHPRRFGIASHIGVLVNKPTIGCAKSRLMGSFVEPGRRKGSFSPLTDGDETIGAVLRTRADVKPVFVSVGHKCTLQDAINIVLKCTTRYRLPEPSRLAHQLVSRIKLEGVSRRG
ncbi:MAG: deoxyribonuclease V [Sedimentisphaerales bacterium]